MFKTSLHILFLPDVVVCCYMLHNLIINNRYENKKTLMIQLEVETDLVGIQGDMRRYAISVVIFHFSWKMQSDVWGEQGNAKNC